MKDIKRRIKSVKSTMQITKAMELVSSSKLRKAKQRAESARPYFNALYEQMCEIMSENTDLTTVFTKKREIKRRLFIVIAGDRGLAGGYNSNIIKMALNAHKDDAQKPKIIAIGKKSIEYFDKHGYEMVGKYPSVAENIKSADTADIAEIAVDMFIKGEIDDVQIFFTTFISPLVQDATQMAVLPVATVQKVEIKRATTYDPSPEAVFNRIIPRFVASLIQCGVVESFASEQGARRTAMESASDNAGQMIDNLSLLYNRARQASITQEITEIVSGAQALD